ncbi:hypothetical protein H5410_051720 [Solanum commersonii]|uniref:Uncharacterized protein n=1 Tax=Solanum commersonii TaxID=4109 RepID=A0A9J5X0W7_SOLCO|nr:hypothetical protein H5410_051720 [Solanum commersonii]
MDSLKISYHNSSGSLEVNIMSSFDSSDDSSKNKYENFKSRPIVLGRVINLSHLRDSHCLVVHLFYANLCISNGSGELETLVLSSCIIVNDLLFEDVFCTKSLV